MYYHAVYTVAFSADGSLLATGSDDGTARIIRTADGIETARIEHERSIGSAAFINHGSFATTAFTDNGSTTRHWLTPEQAMKKLCTERAGRNLSADEWERHIGPVKSWAPTCEEWRTEAPELLAAWKERSASASPAAKESQ